MIRYSVSVRWDGDVEPLSGGVFDDKVEAIRRATDLHEVGSNTVAVYEIESCDGEDTALIPVWVGPQVSLSHLPYLFAVIGHGPGPHDYHGGDPVPVAQLPAVRRERARRILTAERVEGWLDASGRFNGVREPSTVVVGHGCLQAALVAGRATGQGSVLYVVADAATLTYHGTVIPCDPEAEGGEGAYLGTAVPCDGEDGDWTYVPALRVRFTFRPVPE